MGAPVVFGIFTFMMLLQLAWVLFVMPETKGISLEALSASLSD
ncbi:MAG: MFS transporter [Flavobacteriaceae bacterium]